MYVSVCAFAFVPEFDCAICAFDFDIDFDDDFARIKPVKALSPV